MPPCACSTIAQETPDALGSFRTSALKVKVPCSTTEGLAGDMVTETDSGPIAPPAACDREAKRDQPRDQANSS